MSLESIIANAALEVKYKTDPTTKAMIASLYETVTGTKPPARLNVLRWFLETYEFNDTEAIWYHRERVIIH